MAGTGGQIGEWGQSAWDLMGSGEDSGFGRSKELPEGFKQRNDVVHLCCKWISLAACGGMGAVGRCLPSGGLVNWCHQL